MKDCGLIDSHVLGSPHFRKEGLLIGVLDVLKIGRGDLHLMWLNKQKSTGVKAQPSLPLPVQV